MCGQFSDTICVIENLVVIVGRFVPWDILSLGRFFIWDLQSEDVWSLGTFCPGTFCLCTFILIILIRSIGTAVMYNFVKFFEELQ